MEDRRLDVVWSEAAPGNVERSRDPEKTNGTSNAANGR
jgi:hypothetical protein